MPRKTSPARVEAFFRALGQTGNQTIAAERARVSQTWVRSRRAADPAFAARMAAAIYAAKTSLRDGADGVTPAAGWGSLGGEELVFVRGGEGGRTQIARARSTNGRRGPSIVSFAFWRRPPTSGRRARPPD